MLKAITDQIAGTLPSDTVKNPKLGTHPVLSARSYPTQDSQCSNHVHGSINAITIHPKKPEASQVNKPDEGQEEEGNLGNTSSNPHPQPDPLASIATKQRMMERYEHVAMNLVSQLESGTITSIFKYLALKQLAIKRGGRIWLCHSPMFG
ncbi:hypothetical protein Tco_0200900 [Tanacetum coccineum]